MIRTLRALTITSLACIAIYAAVLFWLYAWQFGGAYGVHLNRGESVLLELLLAIVGQTGFYAAFAAGIVAIVASLQERRRGWAAALIALLIVLCYGVAFIDYLIVLVGARFMVGSIGTGSPLLAQLLLSTLLAVFVLIFTFTHRPDTSPSSPAS